MAETALAKKDILEVVGTRIDQMQKHGKLHFPEAYSPQNALQGAWLILQDVRDKNGKPALEVCTKASVCNALLETVQKGLSPAKKQIYYIPHGRQLTAMVSYFGNVAQALRHGMTGLPFAEVVYKDDVFEYTLDPERMEKVVLKHEQKLANIDDGKIVAAYAIARMEDGSKRTDIMTLAEIKKSWARGAMKGQGQLHKDHTAEACRRTVINRLCKMIINASDDDDLMLDGIAGEQYYDDVQAEIEENQAKEVIDLTDDDRADMPEHGPETEESATGPEQQTLGDEPGF